MNDDIVNSDDNTPLPNANNGVLFMDILSILYQKRKIFIITTCLSCIISIILALTSKLLPPNISFLPDIYSPKASVLISDNGDGGLSSALSITGLSSIASLAGVNVGGSTSGLLGVFLAYSPSTLDRLNEEFGFTFRYKIKKSIKAETRKMIMKNLKVDYNVDTSILSITFSDWDPVFAQSVVNKLVDILDIRFGDLGGNKARNQKKLLEEKIGEVQSQINAIQKKIENFQKEYGVLSIEALASEQLTVLARLRSELILKEMEIENYSQYVTIEDPITKKLLIEKDGIIKKITELESGTSILPSQEQIPALTFKYAELERDFMVQNEIMKILIQQYELTKLNAERQESLFQIIDLAEIPDKKVAPSRTAFCLVIVLISVFFAAIYVFISQLIKRVYKDIDIVKVIRRQ